MLTPGTVSGYPAISPLHAYVRHSNQMTLFLWNNVSRMHCVIISMKRMSCILRRLIHYQSHGDNFVSGIFLILSYFFLTLNNRPMVQYHHFYCLLKPDLLLCYKCS